MLKENVIFWSGGKDSTATILLCYENKIEVKEIIFVEVMYDLEKNISGEQPLHIKWIYDVAIPRIKALGFKISVLRANEDYLSLFNHINTKGSRIGKKRGFLLGGMCKANDRLKMKPIRDYRKENPNILELVGIAVEETKRLERLKDNQTSILAQYNYTENQARELCIKYDLLSPIYQYSKRNGCWFCPNRRREEQAKFKLDNPNLWNELVELSNQPNLASYGFCYGKTIKDIDEEIDKINNQMTIYDLLD